ncbi:MAG: hypothetical protein M0Z49_03225 [Chloroflexi bacterium]|nr:hypothetical protein [Chloroflexota bacterium]
MTIERYPATPPRCHLGRSDFLTMPSGSLQGAPSADRAGMADHARMADHRAERA